MHVEIDEEEENLHFFLSFFSVTLTFLIALHIQIEHIANIITHGFWILPAAYAALLLLVKSSSQDQVMVALIYGSALILLFCVSTAFHCVFYCNKDLLLKDVLHRMDRAMIYVFIAGSYFPWLNLGHTQHPYIVCVLKWMIWVLAGLGIIYQQVSDHTVVKIVQSHVNFIPDVSWKVQKLGDDVLPHHLNRAGHCCDTLWPWIRCNAGIEDRWTPVSGRCILFQGRR